MVLGTGGLYPGGLPDINAAAYPPGFPPGGPLGPVGGPGVPGAGSPPPVTWGPLADPTGIWGGGPIPPPTAPGRPNNTPGGAPPPRPAMAVRTAAGKAAWAMR